MCGQVYSHETEIIRLHTLLCKLVYSTSWRNAYVSLFQYSLSNFETNDLISNARLEVKSTAFKKTRKLVEKFATGIHISQWVFHYCQYCKIAINEMWEIKKFQYLIPSLPWNWKYWIIQMILYHQIPYHQIILYNSVFSIDLNKNFIWNIHTCPTRIERVNYSK